MQVVSEGILKRRASLEMHLLAWNKELLINASKWKNMDEIDDVPLISIKGYALSHEEVMRMVKEVEDELSEIRKELGYIE